MKLIDYENCEVAPLDKEFDPIARMVRNPNSYIKLTMQSSVNPKDYEHIMPFIISYYPEVCHNPNFENRLLIYDCINSLKWLFIYPNYDLYNDILFDRSKKLMK